MHELNEQEIARRNSVGEMRKLGIEPYPAAEYPVIVTAREIVENYSAEAGNYQDVSIAGQLQFYFHFVHHAVFRKAILFSIYY
jgi:lysyl-tRNA synthetase class 2